MKNEAKTKPLASTNAAVRQAKNASKCLVFIDMRGFWHKTASEYGEREITERSHGIEPSESLNLNYEFMKEPMKGNALCNSPAFTALHFAKQFRLRAAKMEALKSFFNLEQEFYRSITQRKNIGNDCELRALNHE